MNWQDITNNKYTTFAGVSSIAYAVYQGFLSAQASGATDWKSALPYLVIGIIGVLAKDAGK